MCFCNVPVVKNVSEGDTRGDGEGFDQPASAGGERGVEVPVRHRDRRHGLEPARAGAAVAEDGEAGREAGPVDQEARQARPDNGQQEFAAGAAVDRRADR